MILFEWCDGTARRFNPWLLDVRSSPRLGVGWCILKNVFKQTIDDVHGGMDWSEAEQALLDDCEKGEGVFLPPAIEGRDDFKRFPPTLFPPDGEAYEDDATLFIDDYDIESEPDRHVRASLIRYLLLGGCKTPERGKRPHPKGVVLHRAIITGDLDFGSCASQLSLQLFDCVFLQKLNLRDAKLGGLYLSGSKLTQGADCQRVKIETALHLRTNFQSTATIDLDGARIGGQLACSGGRFDGAGGKALKCDAATIGADVFLRAGFEAKGLVDFVRADIGGNLQLRSARLDGTIVLEAAKIGQTLFLENLERVEDPERDKNTIDLTDTQCGTLHDTPEAWDAFDEINLTHFRYDRLHKLHSAGFRLKWLDRAKQDALEKIAAADLSFKDPKDFDPFPYTHLSKVLEDSGQRRAAARIREAREDRVARAEFQRAVLRKPLNDDGPFLIPGAMLRRLVRGVFKLLFGYGNAPARVIWTILVIWGASWGLYGTAYVKGQFAPNDAVVLTSAHWIDAAAHPDACKPVKWSATYSGMWSANPRTELPDDCAMPLHIWSKGLDADEVRKGPPMDPALEAADYETFKAWLYALDLFVPLDALGQETAWAPSRDRGRWGRLAYYMRMPIQLSGWIITAIAAAVLTGLVGRKD